MNINIMLLQTKNQKKKQDSVVLAEVTFHEKRFEPDRL